MLWLCGALLLADAARPALALCSAREGMFPVQGTAHLSAAFLRAFAEAGEAKAPRGSPSYTQGLRPT